MRLIHSQGTYEWYGITLTSVGRRVDPSLRKIRRFFNGGINSLSFDTNLSSVDPSLRSLDFGPASVDQGRLLVDPSP